MVGTSGHSGTAPAGMPYQRTQPATAALVAIAATIASGSILLMHTYLGSFSRYVADDYWIATRAQLGLGRAVAWWYTHWTGRVSFTTLATLVSLVSPGRPGYLPGALIVCWSVGIYGVLRIKVGRLYAVAGSLAAVAATITVTPNVAQSVYWQACALVVTAPIAWSALAAAAILPAWQSRRSHHAAALAFVASLVAAGHCESLAAMQVASLAVAAACLRCAPGRGYGVTMSALVGALVASLAAAIAPGNAARVATSPHHGTATEILAMSICGAADLLCSIACRGAGPILAVAVLSAVTARTTPGEGIRREVLLVRMSLGVLAAWWLSVLAELPAAYGLGSPLPSRSAILIAWVEVCLAAWIGWHAGQASGRMPGRRDTRRQIGLAAAACAVAIVVVPQISALHALWVQLPTMRAFGLQWDMQEADLRRAQGSPAAIAVVRPVGNPYGLEPAGPDPDHWVNLDVASYYGLRAVTTESDPIALARLARRPRLGEPRSLHGRIPPM